MNNSPTTHRFVAVLNKKIEAGRVMNALGHMAVGFSQLIDDKDSLRFDAYVDGDNNLHKSISDNPFIVLSADNSNQIRTLRNKLVEEGILFNDFLSTMVEGSFAEQHERTIMTPEPELEYYGICFFAKNEKAKELKKKFSLWK